MAERFEVRVRQPSGITDLVTVWEEDPSTAIEAVRSWLQVVHDLPVDSAEFEVRSIGPEPDPADLRVASAPDAVNHRAFSADGRPTHTRFRVEDERVQQLTSDMRSGLTEGWRAVRASIVAKGVAPGDAAVVDAEDVGSALPRSALIVTRDRRVFTYWAGEYWRREPTGGIQKLQGPALEEVPDRRIAMEDAGPLIDAGTRLLERGPLPAE